MVDGYIKVWKEMIRSGYSSTEYIVDYVNKSNILEILINRTKTFGGNYSWYPGIVLVGGNYVRVVKDNKGTLWNSFDEATQYLEDLMNNNIESNGQEL